MASGQLSRKMFTQYHDDCAIIVDQFGRETQVAALTPADFPRSLAALPKTWGLEMIGGTVGRIQSVFKFTSDEQLIDRPVMFGNNFKLILRAASGEVSHTPAYQRKIKLDTLLSCNA